MLCRRDRVVCVGLVACALWAPAAAAQESAPPRWTADRLPLAAMPPAVRDAVRHVADNPTIYAQGPTETFPCDPAVYAYYLDHPDRAVAAWRKLGAKVADVTDRGDGRFVWTDGLGSEVRWQTAHQAERLRVWYAEGKVKPGPLLPGVPFQAVVVLRHVTAKDGSGRTLVRHQADLILHTDSRSALVVTRVLGSNAPRLAEQYVAQLEMFFSALSWYVGQHPERAEELLNAEPGPAPAEQPEPRKRPGLLRSRRGAD
jgi:hypothetical protein